LPLIEKSTLPQKTTVEESKNNLVSNVKSKVAEFISMFDGKKEDKKKEEKKWKN